MSLIDYLALCEKQTCEVLVGRGSRPLELCIWPLMPEEREPLIKLWTEMYYRAQMNAGWKVKEETTLKAKRARV